ncbi:hypothetical protein [Kribbella sp. VKM Ac-2568]|uniref:hypothetical protein n=1 Tax=Kribbella sp. VKM Ac-2568 TaxID=2512219 RepID=UPI00104F8268|nr:hypothetical protein [Kribbella sp. VKM Ac-2568]TCM33680.1 hypothetical protein EV648_1302 [Kribbella sp. VKM Ac-2568]
MVVLIKEVGTGKWVPAKLTSWESEKMLQELLADSPELIPGCAGSAVVKEFGLSEDHHNRVDLVCVDEAGAVTLVECNLASSSESRRSVVGQIFAYASAVQRLSADDFAKAFASRTDGNVSLVDAVGEAAGPDFLADSFMANLAKTLDEGSFRLVVAVDSITAELQKIIEYLERHLSETVTLIAFELGLVKAGDQQILVPNTYGTELPSKDGKARGPHHWSSTELDEAVGSVTNLSERAFAESLLKHAREHGATINGGIGADPSAGFYYSVGGEKRSVWSMWVRPEGTTMAVNVGFISKASEDRGRRMLEQLRRSTTFNKKLPRDDALAMMKNPAVPIASLADADDEQKAVWAAIAEATEPIGQH